MGVTPLTKRGSRAGGEGTEDDEHTHGPGPAFVSPSRRLMVLWLPVHLTYVVYPYVMWCYGDLVVASRSRRIASALRARARLFVARVVARGTWARGARRGRVGRGRVGALQCRRSDTRSPV